VAIVANRRCARWSPLRAALLLAPLLLVGCNGFQAARLYHEGTDALDRGDAAAAVDALERAAELAPRASEVENHLGLAYLEAGRRDAALAAFERATRLDCDNQAARTNLRRMRATGGPN
jgi:Flp pilus assembly protein TadD